MKQTKNGNFSESGIVSFRLISVNEKHFDKIVLNYTTAYELTPVEKTQTGYDFSTLSSIKNPLFIYEYEPSEQINNFFLSEPEEIKNINLSDFEKMLIKSPEGIVTAYLYKNYFKNRFDNDFWYSKELKHIDQNEKICFKFSNYQESELTYTNDEQENEDDFKLKINAHSYSKIENHTETTYVIINNKTVEMFRESVDGVLEKIISGRIISINKDSYGRITKIETLSKYIEFEMLDSREYSFIYEFDTKPLDGFDRTMRNIVVTLKTRPYKIGFQKPHQWSLLFGESIGVVTLS